MRDFLGLRPVKDKFGNEYLSYRALKKRADHKHEWKLHRHDELITSSKALPDPVYVYRCKKCGGEITAGPGNIRIVEPWNPDSSFEVGED